MREGIAVKNVWPGLAIHTDSPMSAARIAEVLVEYQRSGLCLQVPSLWRGRFEPIRLIHVGWEARKARVDAVVLFLDFPFCRT